MIRQTETAECGLVCLEIAAGQLRAVLDINHLRRKYPISARGLTLRQIREIASDLDMVGRALRCEVEELSAVRTPAILHWGMQHFVVLRKIRGKSVLIEDPSYGRKKLSLKEASLHFTGVVLELTRSPNFEKRREPSPLGLRSWFRVVPAMYGPLTQILLLSLFFQLYIVVSPFYIQLAIDQSALKADRNILMVLSGGFCLFSIFNYLANLLRGVITAKLTALLHWDLERLTKPSSCSAGNGRVH